MGRKGPVKKRSISPDSVYSSKLVTRFINTLMERGKKSLAERIFYTALDNVEKKLGEKGIDIFYKAVKNIEPALEVKSRRIGGATYQVPMEVKASKAQILAIKWIIKYARERKEYGITAKITAEIADASRLQGASFKKKEEIHRIAESNKAFAHYRW